MAIDTNEPLTVTVERAAELSGLGRSTLYQLMKETKLEKRKVGRRTLLTFQSLKQLLSA